MQPHNSARWSPRLRVCRQLNIEQITQQEVMVCPFCLFTTQAMCRMLVPLELALILLFHLFVYCSFLVNKGKVQNIRGVIM